MQRLVSDTNILIDMEEGQLIKEMFRLPYMFLIPDILFYEELEEEHPHLINLGLRLNELNGEVMAYALRLTEHYKKPNRNDCFALALAKHEERPLLTGDRALKMAAENEAVVVKGTIWLVNQLVRHQIIRPDIARSAYAQMKHSNRRLPWNTAEEKLIELEKVLSQ